jgi:hypothetical protein
VSARTLSASNSASVSVSLSASDSVSVSLSASVSLSVSLSVSASVSLSSAVSASASPPYRFGGYFCSLRCSDRRWIPSRRAASEMLPPQSDSTRLMCSHSARARLGAR